MNLAVYGDVLAILMTSCIMMTASENVKFTRRKCIHVLKISVAYHAFFPKISVVYQNKIYNG